MYRAYENPVPGKPTSERDAPDAHPDGEVQVEPGSVGPAIHPQQPRANVGNPTPINAFPAPSGPAASSGIPAPTEPQSMPIAARPAPRIV